MPESENNPDLSPSGALGHVPPGWRVECDLPRGRWRLVRRYGLKRERQSWRPLSELPPERVEAARAESARQRALKRMR